MEARHIGAKPSGQSHRGSRDFLQILAGCPARHDRRRQHRQAASPLPEEVLGPASCSSTQPVGGHRSGHNRHMAVGKRRDGGGTAAGQQQGSSRAAGVIVDRSRT